MKVFHLTVFVCLVVVLTTPTAAQSGIGTGVSMAGVEVEGVETKVLGVKTRVFKVPFLCGEIPAGDTAEQGSPLAPGSYRTHIMFAEFLQRFDNVLAITALATDLDLFVPNADIVYQSNQLQEQITGEFNCAFIREHFVSPEGQELPFIRGFMSFRYYPEKRLPKVVGTYTVKNVDFPPPSPDCPCDLSFDTLSAPPISFTKDAMCIVADATLVNVQDINAHVQLFPLGQGLHAAWWTRFFSRSTRARLRRKNSSTPA